MTAIPVAELRPQQHAALPASVAPWPPDEWAADPAAALEVEPLPNNDHLRLGITRYGMETFLKRIKFPFVYGYRRDEGYGLNGSPGVKRS